MQEGARLPRTILRSAGPYSLVKTWYVDGTATDVGTVTVGITDANGDAVVAAGTATTNNADGTYTYSLANQSDLNVLYVTWTRTDTSASLTDRIEVVGNRLFAEAEARAYEISGQQTPLSDVSEYSDSDLRDAADRTAEKFEDFAMRAFSRRYCRMEFKGNGQRRLSVYEGHARTSDGDDVGGRGRTQPRKVIAATVGGTAVSVSNIKIDHAEFVRTDGVWNSHTSTDPFNVVIEYEYGDDPVDLEATEYALTYAVANLVRSDLPVGAVSWSNEDGSFQRDSSGWAYPVKVYEWLKRRRRKVPFA